LKDVERIGQQLYCFLGMRSFNFSYFSRFPLFIECILYGHVIQCLDRGGRFLKNYFLSSSCSDHNFGTSIRFVRGLLPAENVAAAGEIFCEISFTLLSLPELSRGYNCSGPCCYCTARRGPRALCRIALFAGRQR
jgi:hypothetical protein